MGKEKKSNLCGPKRGPALSICTLHVIWLNSVLFNLISVGDIFSVLLLLLGFVVVVVLGLLAQHTVTVKLS